MESVPTGVLQNDFATAPFFKQLTPEFKTQDNQDNNEAAPLKKLANKKPENPLQLRSKLDQPETVKDQQLTASDAFSTLQKAFSSGDSAVKRFVSSIDRDRLTNHSAEVSAEINAVQRKRPKGLRLLQADYQSARRVDKSLSLSLKTQEGDQITLKMDAFMAAELREKFGQGQKGQNSRVSDFSSGSAWQFEVEGDLSADELNAIENLVAKLSGAVSTFYEQDLGSAVSMLSTVDFDTSQILGFSLDMEQSAVATYQAIERFERSPAVEPLAQPGKPIAQSMMAIESFFEEMMETSESFEEGLKQTFLELLLPALYS